jgi:methionine aminotransferase
MTRALGVATIPVSVFSATAAGGERLVRFCFAKNDSTLDAAGARLARLGADGGPP